MIVGCVGVLIVRSCSRTRCTSMKLGCDIEGRLNHHCTNWSEAGFFLSLRQDETSDLKLRMSA